MKTGNEFLKIQYVLVLASFLFIVTMSYNYTDSGRHLPAFAGEQEKENRSGAAESAKSDYGEKALSDKEEVRSYRKDNVVITVKKLFAEDRYSWNFEVTVENLNEIKKTVDGKICLYNMYIQPRECGSEECSVKIAVQPRSVRSGKFKCRGKMDMNSWAFLILEIHNY